MNDPDLERLYARLDSNGLVRRLLELARDEDLGPHALDVTSELVLEHETAEAWVVARESGVCSGLRLVAPLIDVYGDSIVLEPSVTDGSSFNPGQRLVGLRGSARDLTRIERPLLNLLGRMCGIATLTARYVEQAAGVTVLDTRKTTPGLRVVEKYAVACGGGTPHRVGLHDAVLIKDNHIARLADDDLADEITRVAREARARWPDLSFFEVEVDTIDQFTALLAIESGLIDIVLLDNMSADTMRHAVGLRDASGSQLQLEASGGISLDTISEVASTGVDRISVGALTHQAASIDLSLELSP